MRHHIVYCTTNLINNKQYVGVHTTNDLNDGYLGSGTLFKKKLEKYGEDNFERKILFTCTNRKEAYWLESIIISQWVIDKWGFGKYFYNKVPGGLFIDKNRQLTNKMYLKRVKYTHGNKIIPLEKYTGARNKGLHLCNICGHKWKVLFNSIMQGFGCPKCGRKKAYQSQTYSQNEYIEELQKRNKTVMPIEKYINSQTSIKHKCLVCGHIKKVKPNYVLYKSKYEGCPKCGKNKAIKAISKPVIGINKKGDILKFNSTREADTILGVSIASVYKCIKGETKTVKGYAWQYANDNKELKFPEIKKSKAKKVVYKHNGQTKYFNSINEASRELNIDRKLIVRHCNDKLKAKHYRKFWFVNELS